MYNLKYKTKLIYEEQQMCVSLNVKTNTRIPKCMIL